MTNIRVALLLIIIVTAGACGDGQHPEAGGLGAKAPSYADFHINFAPEDKNPPGSTADMAVKYVADKSPADAAKGLGGLLKGDDEKVATYKAVMSGIPRHMTGPIVDALPADLQARAVNALPDEIAIEVMFYVSEATYASIASGVAAFKIYEPLKFEAPKDVSFAGTYELVSVDGKPLPFQYPNADGKFQLSLDSFVWRIRADGGFTTAGTYTHDGKARPDARAGTYWTENGKVETRKQRGIGNEYITLEPTPPDTLTWNAAGVIYVYKKK